MKKYIERESRKKTRLPMSLYNKLKELSYRIGMPVSKVALLMVADTVEYGQDTGKLNYTRNKRRKWKEDNEDKKYKEVNIPINSYLKNCIYAIDYNSVNEFMIDCIDYQIKNNFKHIIERKIQKFSTQKRITHTTSAVFLNRGKKSNENSDEVTLNEKFKESMYSDEVKEKYKLEPPIKKYLQTKAKQYDISENALIMYYASKEINRILSESEKQNEIYHNSDDLDFDY